MKYLFLIYADEAIENDMSGADQGAMLQEYGALSADLEERGTLHGGEALRPISTATTVRVRDGETLVTDGPFAETKEQLGGFYLVDCADLDEALAIAARIPSARYGSVEVRPILTLEEMMAGDGAG